MAFFFTKFSLTNPTINSLYPIQYFIHKKQHLTHQ